MVLVILALCLYFVHYFISHKTAMGQGYITYTHSGYSPKAQSNNNNNNNNIRNKFQALKTSYYRKAGQTKNQKSPVHKQVPVLPVQKQALGTPVHKQVPVLPVQKQAPGTPVHKQIPVSASS